MKAGFSDDIIANPLRGITAGGGFDDFAEEKEAKIRIGLGGAWGVIEGLACCPVYDLFLVRHCCRKTCGGQSKEKPIVRAISIFPDRGKTRSIWCAAGTNVHRAESAG